MSSIERDLNLQTEKINGYGRLSNDVIGFLCKWKEYPTEDVIFGIVDAQEIRQMI
jgi:hypothetical protein